jgi:hypothetical protein
MNKSSVFVAADGQREALVEYFRSLKVSGTPPDIARETLPEDSSESVVSAVGGELAEMVMPSHLVLQYVEGSYPMDRNGLMLGWEVVVYAEPWDDEPLDVLMDDRLDDL